MGQKRTKRIKRQRKAKPLDEVDWLLLEILIKDRTLGDQAIAEMITPTNADGSKGNPPYTRIAINKRRRNPLLQEVLNDPAKEVIAVLKKAKFPAARKLKKHIHNPDDHVSIRACEDILEAELKTTPVVSIDLSGYATAWDKKLKEDKEKADKEKK